MARDISPEERLLRLIRSKPPNKELPPEGQTEGIPGKPQAAPSLVTGNVPSSSSKKEQMRRQLTFTPAKILKFETLNLILIFLLAGLVAYLVPLFLKKPAVSIESLEERLKAQGSREPSLQAGAPSAEKKPPLTYFSGGVGTKNIFSPIAKEETAPQSTAEQGPKLEDIKTQLNLLGIVGGDSPQAIIEDKSTQKSYFLNKGSTFGDIEVKDIRDNKVILSYKGQEFELVL